MCEIAFERGTNDKVTTIILTRGSDDRGHPGRRSETGGGARSRRHPPGRLFREPRGCLSQPELTRDCSRVGELPITAAGGFGRRHGSSISGDLAGESRLPRIDGAAGRGCVVSRAATSGARDRDAPHGGRPARPRAESGKRTTSTPLQPGDRVWLEVVTAGATPEFRIATDKTAVTKTAVTAQAATAQPPASAGRTGRRRAPAAARAPGRAGHRPL